MHIYIYEGRRTVVNVVINIKPELCAEVDVEFFFLPRSIEIIIVCFTGINLLLYAIRICTREHSSI